MESVFAHADRLFALFGRLVRRPKKGELPQEVPDRGGIPVLSLIGDHQDGLAEQVGRALSAATPRHVPHQFVDMDAMWERVVAKRGDLAADWQRAELCRQVLVDLAREFSSARYGPDQPVRFRRFGLVNWLLEMTHTDEEPNSRHAGDMLRRLRDREIQRTPFLRGLRSPSTEVSLQGQVPWWAYLLGLHVLPLVWFRAWRVLGSEYRWLLRQPYMAPGDPGTFDGFALRLTQPRWGREDPAQITKLMINAFLEDLRVAYRRRPWRRRAYRRTAYCVAYLKGVSDENNGRSLVRWFIEVRNETGAFDPLLIVTSATEAEHEHRRVRSLTDELDPYAAWCERLRSAGRSRGVDFWYLPVRVDPPLADEDPELEAQSERTAVSRRFTLAAPPLWASRRTTGAAFVLALALLATGVADRYQGTEEWERQHCGLSRGNPDAETLRLQGTGECVGVAPHGHAFGTDDERLSDTLATIAEQNAEADRIHRQTPGRPVVTLVHVTALLSSPGGEPSSGVSYGRQQLQGVASAQRRQLERNGERDPVLRIFPANAGAGMRYGEVVAGIIEDMRRSDPTIVGVTGLDQSREATIATIGELTRVGLPMVATTLSADTLDDHSPLYYQVSPQNRREAAVAAAYADHLADRGYLPVRTALVLYSSDPTDEYSANLGEDVVEALGLVGFEIDSRGFDSPTAEGSSGAAGPRTAGEAACGYQGLVFYAGRAEDFEPVLSGINSVCGSDPPTILAGDDVARFGADVERRRAFPKIAFDFLDFTVGSISCNGRDSDLYNTMRELFPAECAQAPDTSLDGHAALAFDAVNLYLTAIDRLRELAPRLPLTPQAVWQGLGRINGAAAMDGESGRIDFGGSVDQQVPVDKLISMQRVEGGQRPRQVGFCGQLGGKTQATWCPAPEARLTPGPRPPVP